MASNDSNAESTRTVADIESEYETVFSIPHPSTGKPILTLTLHPQGPCLTLWDYEGRARVRMDACPFYGAEVAVNDAHGDPVAFLGDLGTSARGRGAVGVATPNPADSGAFASFRAVLLSHDEAAGPESAPVLETWNGPLVNRQR